MLKEKDKKICLQETNFRFKDTTELEVKLWEKVYYANSYHKKTGVAIIISDKTDI